jgi:hypothetical protein
MKTAEQRSLTREQKQAIGLLSIGTFLEYLSLLNSLCKFSHKYLKFYPQILSKNEPWLHSNFGWA